MKPSPANFPRITPSLYYQDASKAIDWLCRVFGFEVRLKVEGEDGSIHHSELVLGDGVIMVSEEGGRSGHPQGVHWKSPRSLGNATTQGLMVYVDDVEAHCAHARAAGAKILSELKTSDYGEEYWTDRSYGVEDLDGHHFWFTQRLRDPSR